MKNIKLLGYVGLLSLGLSVTSCETETNNDELMSHINSLKDRISALESLQTQVDALKALMEASSMNYMITSVEEIKDESDNVIGYKISFSDREPIEIYNGGGNTAGMSVTIEADENGKLCWKLNGEFLEVEGEHVEAEGKTPLFQMGEDGILEISYDDGATYTDVPNAEIGGEIGSSVTVTDKGAYYEFTISGQTYNVLKYKELTVLFTGSGVDGNVAIVDESTNPLEITYEIDGLYEGQSSVIMAFAGEGCSVALDETQQKMTVTPDESVNLIGKKITVFVSDGGQRTIMRTISFVDTVLDLSGTEVSGNTLTVPEQGETMTVAVSSNYESSEITVSIPENAKDWITVDESSTIKSRAIESYNLILTFTANEGISRTAELSVGKADGKNVTLTVKQTGALGDPVSLTVNYTGSSLETFLTNTGNTGGVNITTVTDLTITGAKLVDADLKYLTNLSKNNSLRNLDISASSTTQLVYQAFYQGLFTSINLPTALTSIAGSAFASCANLTELIIPEKVSTVSNYAFSGCTNLKVIKFTGNSLEFKNTNDSNANNVFKDCTSLENITILSETVPEISLDNSNNFTGVPANCILYVPSDLVDDYQSSNWGKALGADNIQQIPEEAVVE